MCTVALKTPAPAGNRTRVSLFTLPPCQMALTVVSVLLIALFNYVNSTANRNFKFKPDLTLIKATTEPYLLL